MLRKQSSRVTKLFILHGGKMKIEYDQKNKSWKFIDDNGNEYHYKSIAECRDMADHYENMKRYKQRDKK